MSALVYMYDRLSANPDRPALATDDRCYGVVGPHRTKLASTERHCLWPMASMHQGAALVRVFAGALVTQVAAKRAPKSLDVKCALTELSSADVGPSRFCLLAGLRRTPPC